MIFENFTIFTKKRLLLDSMSNIFYMHDRDYSDLDLSEHYSKEIAESAQISWSKLENMT